MIRRLLLAVLFAGVMAIGYGLVADEAEANPCGFNPCNPCAKNPCNPCNPCAKNPCNPCAKNPCNPCAKNPCNPCAKNPCNPCGKNPCAKMKPIRKHAVKDEVYSLKMGEKLWSDSSIGNSGMSCATCHPDGAGLKTEAYPRYIKMAGEVLTKTQMINFCMLNPMDGKVYPQNHQVLTYMSSYIKDKAGSNPCGMNPCGKNPCAR